MAFSYGFYNSLNGDRKYDANQMCSIFDGIIMDGIFMSIGDKLMVKPNPSNANSVIVGSGRAWFNHTWNYNDADIVLDGYESELILDRIDAVVIDINSDNRTNSIKWVKGVANSNPSKPSLSNSNGHFQYPLAFVRRNKNSSIISTSDIENSVGTSSCPFVTGPLNGITTDELITQWAAQWSAWTKEQKEDFLKWFDALKDVLDDNAATNLFLKISELNDKIEDLHTIPKTTPLKNDSITNFTDSMYNSDTWYFVSVANGSTNLPHGNWGLVKYSKIGSGSGSIIVSTFICGEDATTWVNVYANNSWGNWIGSNDKTQRQSFNALEQIGASKNNTLIEIILAMPDFSYLSVWINSGTLYQQIMSEIGISAQYGDLEIIRNRSLWIIRFVLYNSNTTYVRRYTTTNNRGFTSWEKEGIEDPLIGYSTSAAPVSESMVANGNVICDTAIFSGTWLVWGYANGTKVRIQDNKSVHALYRVGINPISVITVTSETDIQLVNASGSSINVYADASNYYLMATRLK